ncbi:MAG: lysophospholipid acyltransferase family protein [Bacteroidia bacterium]
MKSFFGGLVSAVYSAYVILLFFVFTPLVLVYYILISPFPTNTRMRLVYKCHWVWMTIWAFMSGIKMEVQGKEKLVYDQTYVFLPNHSNLFDIVLAGSRIQHPFKPLAKRELWRIPFLGQLFAMAAIPVDRSSKESRAHSFELMVSAVKKGTSILIFPEGTRNRTAAPLKAFYDGGFRLAIAGQVPIMPVMLLNVRQLQPVGTFRVYPGRVSLHFLDPIPVTGLTENDVESLKKQVYDLMEKYILANDSWFIAQNHLKQS